MAGHGCCGKLAPAPLTPHRPGMTARPDISCYSLPGAGTFPILLSKSQNQERGICMLATKNHERREHRRFEAVKAIYIEIAGRRRRPESENTIIRCETVDVSVGGLKIRVPQPISPGSRLHIGVPLDGKNNLELTGQAVWAKPMDDDSGYWVGLRLDDSDRDTMEKWFRVVHSMSRTLRN